MTHPLPKGILARTIFGLYIFSVLTFSSSVAGMEMKVEQNEILVIGTGIVVDGNVAKAKKTAISEALVKGIEEYLARRLGSQGMINNFPGLVHDVIPGAREEIENFHILAEDLIDSHYKILVRLKVNERMIEEKLKEIGLVLMEGPAIKILFLVSQLESRKGEVSYWWKDPGGDSGLTPTELALHRVFQERGFSPISRLLNVPEEDFSSEMMVLDLSDEDVIRWGRAFSADVVIYGRCKIVEKNEVSISFSALDTDRGIMIYQDSQAEVIGEGPDSMEQTIRTIERAINKVAARFGPAILGAIKTPEVSINQLEIAIKGLRSFKQFRELRDFLKGNIAGVKSVTQTRVRSDLISIMVEFSGDKDKFLDMMLNLEDLPFRADVSETNEGGLIIKIRQP
ncbi:MAG: hypothetical protein JRJ02_05445 [Deltaproteobacteria bacterium]|nr:hypothetical protein [Deltaproteobacteria bacterium]